MSTRKQTVLIAEDDKRIAAALTVRLEAAGYKTVTTPDGFRSFMTAVSGRPDLILMDVFMPIASGFSVAEELRKADLADIPIIIVTASKKKSVREQAAEIGAAAFFEKPFDAERLLAAIARALNRRTSRRNAATAAPGNRVANFENGKKN